MDAFAPALKRLQRVSGTSSIALLQKTAEALGEELARAMTSSSPDSVFEELQLLFDSLGLGKIAVERDTAGFTLIIDQCLGCEQIPDAAQPVNCALREGVLKAIFDERLGVNSQVKFQGSRGSEFGAKTCRFFVKFESQG